MTMVQRAHELRYGTVGVHLSRVDHNVDTYIVRRRSAVRISKRSVTSASSGRHSGEDEGAKRYSTPRFNPTIYAIGLYHFVRDKIGIRRNNGVSSNQMARHLPSFRCRVR